MIESPKTVCFIPWRNGLIPVVNKFIKHFMGELFDKVEIKIITSLQPLMFKVFGLMINVQCRGSIFCDC